MARMRDLYYDRDRPMIEVADAFGVPVSTFLRWIAEMGWPRRTSVGRRMDYGSSPGPPIRSQAGVGSLPTRLSPQGSGEAPHPVASRQGRLVDIPLPASGGRETRGPTIDDEAFAIEVAVAARRELRALGDLSGPVDKNLTLGERERRAALIANLSRSIARLDRVFELRTQRKALKLHIKHLEDELEAARNADIHAMVTDTAKVMLSRYAGRKTKPRPKPPEKRTLYTPPDF